MRDPPEFGLSGWRVWLDRDRDGVFDPGEPSDVTAGAAGPAGVYSIAGVKPSAAAAPLRHAEVEPVGVAWKCTQPVTTDGHGCFTDVRPKSGDRLERDLGDHATEPTTPVPPPPGPQPPAPSVGGLQIAVAVVSDDGGSLAEVTLRVMQGGLDIEGSPRPSSAQGADFTLAPGTYTVDVAGAAGYAESAAGDCAANGTVVINSGFTSSCTITVNDIAPTIKVITDVINDNGLSLGAGSFTSRVRTTGPFPADVPGSPMQGSATGATFTVHANKDSYPYEVYEDDPAPLHYLRTKITGDCDSMGRISLAVGEHKTCRITNDDVKAPDEPTHPGRLADHAEEPQPLAGRDPADAALHLPGEGDDRRAVSERRRPDDSPRLPWDRPDLRGRLPALQLGQLQRVQRVRRDDHAHRRRPTPPSARTSPARPTSASRWSGPDGAHSPRSRTPSSSKPMWWASSWRTVIVTCSRSRSGSCPKSRRSVSR